MPRSSRTPVACKTASVDDVVAVFDESHAAFYELQSLLEVITRDYHPFCCGGTCVMPDDLTYHWSFKDKVNQEALTQLISQLPVVNTAAESPLASVDDIEVAEMLTSISDYTQYMLGQGVPVVLNPCEVHVHTLTATEKFKVPPKARAAPGEHIGTVILALPSTHSESQLSITWTTGLTHSVDLPSNSADENRIQWMAYHGACSYSLSPIKEGQVVVATYDIVSVPDPEGREAVCLVEDPELLPPSASFHRGPRAKGIADEVLRKLVKRVEAAQAIAGQDLGIMLSRKYSQEELHPLGLKGGDRLVWGALSERWQCGLRTVLEPEELTEARKKEAAAAGDNGVGTGDEEEVLVEAYVVQEAGQEVVGDSERVLEERVVVSSDGCYSPGLLRGEEVLVGAKSLNQFGYRPAVLALGARK